MGTSSPIRPAKEKPLVCRSTDHPVIIEKDSVRNRTTAIFHGGWRRNTGKTLPSAFYLRWFGQANYRVVSIKKRENGFDNYQKPVSKGDLGMWDLPGLVFVVKLYSRACDDLIGCVSFGYAGRGPSTVCWQKRVGIVTVAENRIAWAKYAAMKKLIQS
jgi:hypothetical protein